MRSHTPAGSRARTYPARRAGHRVVRRRRRFGHSWARSLLLAAVVACSESTAGGSDGESSTDDQVPLPGDPVPPADARFDPAELRVGQQVLGLTVASVDVRPAPDLDFGYIGEVAFKGEVTVSGRYRAHPDYPQPGADYLCFFVDAESVVRLPRFRGDERYPWFCFTNREVALEELGPMEAEGAATVVIDDYRTVRRPTDAFDTATLLRVLSKDEKDEA